MDIPREQRLKRAKIRASRRGMKEMDLIFDAFCETKLAELADREIDIFETLLEEADQDLYGWVVDPGTAPPKYQNLVNQLVSCAIR